MNILLVDNFDSFTFNLVDDFRKRGSRVEVWRNDIGASRALEIALGMPSPRLLVLSPGPGRPEDAGCCQDLVRLACGHIPTFGVCLGLQAMVQAFGGRVGPAGEVVHGKSVWIEHDGSNIFVDMPSPLQVGRYHSLVATDVPADLRVMATYQGLIMAVAHREQPVLGVQFHPESVLTPRGGPLLERVVDWAAKWAATGSERGV